MAPLSRIYATYLLSCIFFCCLLSTKAYSDDCEITPQAELSLTYNGFVPTASAKLNGQTIEMGIDTGAQHSVITPALMEKLHLLPDPHRQTRVYGTSGHQIVPNALVDTLSFAGVDYHHISMPVVSLTLPNIGRSPSPNNEMEGLIGVDILAHYDLEFDFPGKKLTLYRVARCSSIRLPWDEPYMTMPMLLTPSHRPTIQLELDGHLATAIFDTGASGARLDPSALDHIGLSEEAIKKDPLHDGAGIGGAPYKVPSHTFLQVKIGTQTYNNIIMDIVGLGSTEADAILGEDYMHSRHFWLSYATQTLYIEQAAGHQAH